MDAASPTTSTDSETQIENIVEKLTSSQHVLALDTLYDEVISLPSDQRLAIAKSLVRSDSFHAFSLLSTFRSALSDGNNPEIPKFANEVMTEAALLVVGKPPASVDAKKIKELEQLFVSGEPRIEFDNLLVVPALAHQYVTTESEAVRDFIHQVTRICSEAFAKNLLAQVPHYFKVEAAQSNNSFFRSILFNGFVGNPILEPIHCLLQLASHNVEKAAEHLAEIPLTAKQHKVVADKLGEMGKGLLCSPVALPLLAAFIDPVVATEDERKGIEETRSSVLSAGDMVEVVYRRLAADKQQKGFVGQARAVYLQFALHTCGQPSPYAERLLEFAFDTLAKDYNDPNCVALAKKAVDGALKSQHLASRAKNLLINLVSICPENALGFPEFESPNPTFLPPSWYLIEKLIELHGQDPHNTTIARILDEAFEEQMLFLEREEHREHRTKRLDCFLGLLTSTPVRFIPESLCDTVAKLMYQDSERPVFPTELRQLAEYLGENLLVSLSNPEIITKANQGGDYSSVRKVIDFIDSSSLSNKVAALDELAKVLRTGRYGRYCLKRCLLYTGSKVRGRSSTQNLLIYEEPELNEACFSAFQLGSALNLDAALKVLLPRFQEQIEKYHLWYTIAPFRILQSTVQNYLNDQEPDSLSSHHQALGAILSSPVRSKEELKQIVSIALAIYSLEKEA